MLGVRVCVLVLFVGVARSALPRFCEEEVGDDMCIADHDDTKCGLFLDNPMKIPANHPLYARYHNYPLGIFPNIIISRNIVNDDLENVIPSSLLEPPRKKGRGSKCPKIDGKFGHYRYRCLLNKKFTNNTRSCKNNGRGAMSNCGLLGSSLNNKKLSDSDFAKILAVDQDNPPESLGEGICQKISLMASNFARELGPGPNWATEFKTKLDTEGIEDQNMLFLTSHCGVTNGWQTVINNRKPFIVQQKVCCGNAASNYKYYEC